MKISSSQYRIKELLEMTDDTQAEMSRKIGVSKTTVGRYIKGTQEPHQAALSKMASVYRVSPAWLMGFDVPMNEVSAEEIYNMLDLLNASDREMVVKLIEHLAERKKDERGETAIRTLQNKKANRRKEI